MALTRYTGEESSQIK
jgi:hypothetical protein